MYMYVHVRTRVFSNVHEIFRNPPRKLSQQRCTAAVELNPPATLRIDQENMYM